MYPFRRLLLLLVVVVVESILKYQMLAQLGNGLFQQLIDWFYGRTVDGVQLESLLVQTKKQVEPWLQILTSISWVVGNRHPH